MKRVLGSIFAVVFMFTLFFLGYWLGGGVFERGEGLGGIYTISALFSLIAVVFYNLEIYDS
jgi:hypothetical protein